MESYFIITSTSEKLEVGANITGITKTKRIRKCKLKRKDTKHGAKFSGPDRIHLAYTN